MSAPTNQGAQRIRLGELLVQAGVLSADKLKEALALQRDEGNKRRLGRVLVDAGFVDETLLTQVLGRQLSVPWVSLYHVDFSRQLLNLVPREVAEGYGVIPVYVRHVRGQGETLYVATDDPTNEEGLRRAASYAGLPVRPMIASASDIRAAIRAYYGGAAPSVAKLKVEPAAAPAAPEPVAAPAVAEPAATAPVAPVVAAPAAPVAPVVAAPPEPRIEERQPEAAAAPYDDTPELEVKSLRPPPDAGKKKKRRAIALTFLDGTTIKLPAPRRPGEPREERRHDNELTAREIVAALRAASTGDGQGEATGENPRWEAMFGALLSLLLKKHLIADWEFVEALRELRKR